MKFSFFYITYDFDESMVCSLLTSLKCQFAYMPLKFTTFGFVAFLFMVEVYIFLNILEIVDVYVNFLNYGIF